MFLKVSCQRQRAVAVSAVVVVAVAVLTAASVLYLPRKERYCRNDILREKNTKKYAEKRKTNSIVYTIYMEKQTT